MPAKHLVIVESPAKGKTIERYLGKDFHVLASYGHVRDLPEHNLGVDVEHKFKPTYVIPQKAKKTISALKTALKGADSLYLATDYDREGEAIAWHILEALNLEKMKIPVARITFHEITKSALQAAIKKPRSLDLNLVNAQQARRILDRLVGYTLSPFLWKKVMKGLSAGRVQSVAVRLVVDREREIKAFVPQEHWSLEALLATRKKEEFRASLAEFKGKKLDKLGIKTEKEARALESALAGVTYQVKLVEEKEITKRPSPPFTTSTLQQQASHRLHFSAKQTMKLAQDLYEAGHITYMRTDSTNLAGEAISATRGYIEKTFGANYLPSVPQYYRTKSKGAQEAHEAIRPTDATKQSSDLNLPSDKHAKLYELIWQRMIACQMAPARLKATTALIQAGEGIFKAHGNVVAFDGYLRVWPSDRTDSILPKLASNDSLTLQEFFTEQHFTEPPARYSEATLVKALEEHGIGRPSTYAPIISTIQDRGYVQLFERRFQPTETGEIVTNLLVEHFPEIVDLTFTASMEKKLDQVAEGEQDWTKLLGDFYTPFDHKLEVKQKEVEKLDLTEKTDKTCPKCGKPLIIRRGRFGRFLACTGFPECRHTEAIVEKTGIQCPECGQGELIEKKTRRGKTFWGCERYPECKHATWNDPRSHESSS